MWYKISKKSKDPSATDSHWGYHLLVDASEVNNNIKDKETIKDFISTLVKKIDMIAVGNPIIKELLPGQKNAGYSAMQLIETSSITCHFVDPVRHIYLDVFSCKSFEPKDALAVLDEFFAPKHKKYQMIYRDADQIHENKIQSG